MNTTCSWRMTSTQRCTRRPRSVTGSELVRGGLVSVESLAGVLHHSRAKGTAKLVLVGIANHDGDGGAWPTVATLAKYANVTERNVQAAINKLVSLGELAVHVQAGGTVDAPDHTRPNRYDVLVSCPPWCDRTTQHRDTRATRQANLRGVAIDTPPVSLSTPPPVSLSTPKPSLQTITTPVRSSTTDRARSCAVCSAPDEVVCWERQRKLTREDRHSYAAR